MAYKAVFDFTQQAINEKKANEPLQTPFGDPEGEDYLEPDTAESIPETMQAGLRGMGWPGLMPVQAQAIPYILDGRDLVVQSKTGSGKTGAFLLPLLETLDPDEKTCQALCLCPTRELARQIHDEFSRMNAALPDEDQMLAVPVYGGTAYEPQIEAFKKGAQVVIGTPGRVLDHIARGTLKMDALRTLILDEADEMLSMGFYPDMLKLRRYLPKERDGFLFSATMPYQVQRLAQQFLTRPVFLAPQGGAVHVEQMTHRAYQVNAMDKDRTLATLIEWENPSAAIIFANTKREVEYLEQFLSNYGFDAKGISSNLTQSAREKVMGRLRRGELRFLVATDVAARGIDIPDLSHVFQYDVPQDREYYVHRSGRTARAGKAGVSIAIVTPTDAPTLKQIARKYDIPMEWRDVPSPEELASRVGQRQTTILEDRLRDRSNMVVERQKRFVPVVRQLVEEGEPEILAMLLDEVYQESLHAVVELGPAEDDYEVEGEEEHDGGVVRDRRSKRSKPAAEARRPRDGGSDADDRTPREGDDRARGAEGGGSQPGRSRRGGRRGGGRG